MYFLKRKFTENVRQNTLNCTIDKKSGEYAPIPLNIVRSNIIIIIYYFYMNNEYFYNFLGQNFSKIFPKTHQIAPFLNPPNKRAYIPPLFQKYVEPPPPKKKNPRYATGLNTLLLGRSFSSLLLIFIP